MQRDLAKSWIEDEDFFRHQCQLGRKYEALTIQKLIGAGIPAKDFQLMDDGFRDNPGEIAKYTANSKDLLIKGWPFEVKSRNVYFTTPDDWPSNYWPMFLDTVKGFEAKVVKPVGYIFISQKNNALLGASMKNKSNWTRQKKFDRERQIWDEFYCLGRDDVFDETELIARLQKMPTRQSN